LAIFNKSQLISLFH